MRKKLLSMLLATTMVAGCLVGCGSSDDSNDGGKATNDGKVLNIYCWNDEFQSRVKSHYPDYKEVSATEGKIGDVTVKWNITPTEDNAYQNNLDSTLKKQKDAKADDKIDLFLLEADYALKYVDTDYTMDVSKLGITDADTADQYQYTKDVMTDSNGKIKGLSWQGCPGVLFYNREVAKEVLGSDDPAEVQNYVKDWDTFTATAETMKAAGYNMVSSVNDTYRVYSNNVSGKWVDADKNIKIDDNIKKWVDDSKKLVDAKEAGTHDLWGDDWSKGFYPEGKVFCYFGPAWLINFCMAADQEGSIAANGQWGAAEGPQGFFWGGTWIAGANGTDNADLVKDIMLKMTTDEDILTDIVVQDDDFANNQKVMEALASGEKKVKDADGNEVEYSSKILGGQNPLPMYCAGASKVDLSNQSAYDQGCNEEFQNAMKNYFEGACSYDDAVAQFEKAVKEKYPDLDK